MRKLFYKALYRLTWCLNWCEVGAIWLFIWSPWGRAYVCLALEKYIQSDWYKARSEIFVKRRAIEMYFDHNESWLFKRRITGKEKLGIAFAPFAYINKSRQVVYDYGLIDYM